MRNKLGLMALVAAVALSLAMLSGGTAVGATTKAKAKRATCHVVKAAKAHKRSHSKHRRVVCSKPRRRLSKPAYPGAGVGKVAAAVTTTPSDDPPGHNPNDDPANHQPNDDPANHDPNDDPAHHEPNDDPADHEPNHDRCDDNGYGDDH